MTHFQSMGDEFGTVEGSTARELLGGYIEVVPAQKRPFVVFLFKQKRFKRSYEGLGFAFHKKTVNQKRTAFLFLLPLVLLLGLFAHGRGGVPLAAPEAQILNQLLLEFPEEIKYFDQTTETTDTLKAFQEDWQKSVLAGQPLPFHWKTGYTWSNHLQKFFSDRPLASHSLEAQELENLKTHFDGKQIHSIEDPKLYSLQRIGGKIVEALKKSKTKVIIYAGEESSLFSSLNVQSQFVHFLPSVYEDWGIEKVFISGKAFPDGLPRFVVLIPPSHQYAIHYAQLFQSLDLPPEKVLLNRVDQAQQIAGFKNSFRELGKKLPEKPDVVVLGYYDQMKALLTTGVDFQEIPMENGLTALWVRDEKSELKANYLLLKSDRTIWGESSAYVIEGALELSPRAVLFMGSAGGISPQNHLYDISIPAVFSLEHHDLAIRNEIFESFQRQNLRPSAGMVMGGHHGHTNSPIEQTKKFVSSKLSEGLDSMDVEQNLIAQTILLHNQKEKAEVLFGAINLITDKPKSLDFDWSHGFDLSRVNPLAKSKARNLAVTSALDALRSSNHLRVSQGNGRCERIFLATPSGF